MHDFDVEHAHYDEPLAAEESANAWSPELIVLRSLGVDIGSSTSHLVVSQLALRRQGRALASRFEVASREILYRSPILLTPYSAPQLIDAASLRRFVDASYLEAATRPEAIDTGAVILTGEAVRKENARSIAELFASDGGKFVCAVAGHKLEATLAAYGSGAVAFTEAAHQTILNVDIGGGTAKLAVVHGGAIRDVAVINVGARLVAFDSQRVLTRVERSLAPVLNHLGLRLAEGDTLTAGDARRLAETLADALFELIERRKLSALAQALMLTPPLTSGLAVDAVMFTGGVAEYIYGRQDRGFGDLGLPLARCVRERAQRSRAFGAIAEPRHRLYATVIGASQHTLQLSGSTIFCSRPGLLPLRNLPVLSPTLSRRRFTSGAICESIRGSLDHFEIVDGERPFALAVRWGVEPSYANLRTFALGLRQAVPETLARGTLALVFDRDLGQSIGRLLVSELFAQGDLICLDEVELKPFDTIDIGAHVGQTKAVPVVIKSMVFG